MSTEPSFLKNAGRTALDWLFALSLTAAGFWLLSWWRTPTLPDEAPLWTLSSLEGESVSLSDFEGQTVVLNFWATWCGPCKMEIPEFRKFAADHPEIPVLGIAVDGTPSTLRQFAKQYKINYPILQGTKSVQREYNVSSLPMTIVVGPDGEVEDVHIGVMMASQLEWATRLD